MQNDDVTWSIIGKHHCSYKLKSETQSFCRNEFNVTGLCNRKACPLANSQYATVREHKGVLFLYIKEAEKVQTPCHQWKKVRLSKTFMTALQQIEDNLVFWPMYFRQKCRQRVFKISQYLVRMRKMKLNDTKNLVPVRRKEERRLARREEKALVAAKLDHAIEKQLLTRLKEGTYERIYNFPKKAFNVHTEDAQEDLLDEELDEEEEEEGERVRVKEEEEMEEEEVDEEVEQEVARELVRQRREDSDADSEDGSYAESDAEDGEELLDDEEIEDMDSDEEEEEDSDAGQVEYVADFEESEDEEISDIEDAAAKLQLHAKGKRPAAAANGAGRSAAGDDPDDSSDDDHNEQISRKKYGPKKPVKPSAKFGYKRMVTQQKIRQIYEKQKAAKQKNTKINR